MHTLLFYTCHCYNVKQIASRYLIHQTGSLAKDICRILHFIPQVMAYMVKLFYFSYMKILYHCWIFADTFDVPRYTNAYITTDILRLQNFMQMAANVIFRLVATLILNNVVFHTYCRRYH